MKISLEKLAEKLNGKYWEKGDKRRIYLRKGYNTKKMKTTTYVEESSNSFVVKCYIDCPSQPYQWRKSQQDIIIDSVEESIQHLTLDHLFVIQDINTKMYYNCIGDLVPLSDLDDYEKFISEDKASEEADDMIISDFKIVQIENN